MFKWHLSENSFCPYCRICRGSDFIIDKSSEGLPIEQRTYYVRTGVKLVDRIMYDTTANITSPKHGDMLYFTITIAIQGINIYFEFSARRGYTY